MKLIKKTNSVVESGAVIFSGLVKKLPPNEYATVLEYEEIFYLLQKRDVIRDNQRTKREIYSDYIEDYYRSA